MLQEMQRWRAAESAQAGRGNLQTQTRVSDWAEPSEASQEMEQEGKKLGNWALVPEARPYLCSERGARGGEGSRPWCTQPLSPQWGWAAQASFSPHPLPGKGLSMQMCVLPGTAQPLPAPQGWRSAHTPDKVDGDWLHLLKNHGAQTRSGAFRVVGPYTVYLNEPRTLI